MKCVICNYENPDATKFCNECGADMYINKKTRSIAIMLYNKGIVMAQERKLAESAELLRKSVYFDRFNVNALNALGLVYFEMGMIGDALKQWATSASYFKNNNLANLYLNRIKDNVREMDKMNDAVKMYNKGLNSVIHVNDDMAVIQLKKAIELNPRLIDAKNLLAFVYLRTKETQNAAAIIDSVLSHDASNSTALGYKINGGIGHQAAVKPSQPTRREYTAPQYKASYSQKKGFPLSEMISLIVGAACALAAMYFLVIPSISDANAAEIDMLAKEMAAAEQTYRSDIIEKNDEIKALNEKNEELIATNEQMRESAKQLEIQQKIMTAASFNASGNIKEAASILMDIDTEGMTDAELSQYTALKETTYPAVAAAFFNEGRAFYNTRRYDEAKSALENGLVYGMTVSNAGDAHYFLGRIAENNGDTAEAKLNYEKTVNEFKNCTQYYNASNRLRNLN